MLLFIVFTGHLMVIVGEASRGGGKLGLVMTPDLRDLRDLQRSVEIKIKADILGFVQVWGRFPRLCVCVPSLSHADAPG